MVFNYHSYDPKIVISNDTLNDGCKIVEPENPLDILAAIHPERTTVRKTIRRTVESNPPSVVSQDESESSEDGEPPGRSDEAPGRSDEPPGQNEEPPGQLSQDSFLNYEASVPGDLYFDSCSDDDIASQAR